MEKAKKSKSIYYKFLGRTYIKNDSVVGIAFILPAVVLGAIFVIAPMVVSLSYAFTDANLLKLNEVGWAGVQQFKKAFTDKFMWNAFKNTMIFVAEVVPLQLLAALGLALILNTKIKGNTFFRWAFFCPVMLSLAVTSFLWMNLLNPQEGLINALLGVFHIPPQQFLESPKQAMNVIVIVSAWQGAGYQMLIFLSGLKNIPPELYEAAGVDGAGSGTKFFRITIPSILPTFSFVLVTMLIGAFRLMTQPMIMTQGGPVDSTMTMSYYIYQQGIKYRDVGYSSAIALLYTLFMSTIALTLRKVTDQKD
ncbi:MAG: sugar ABC transporter permease [Clostridia bacterium]|nr:sugar ABC transporter permease [Clostridia bacterium]